MGEGVGERGRGGMKRGEKEGADDGKGRWEKKREQTPEERRRRG